MQEQKPIKEATEEEKDASSPYKVFATREEWQESIDKIIGLRLKEFRETKEELLRLRPLIGELLDYTGAREESALLEKLKEKVENAKKEGEMHFIPDGMSEKDAARLSQNRYFQMAIDGGLSRKEAFRLAALDENAAKSEEEKPLEEKAVSESALTAENGVIARLTPSKMTFAELDKISERVAKGEKIFL